MVVKATPKQRLIAMVCDSELHTIILWIVISMKLDVGKKMAGLETMTWDCEKIYHVSELVELIIKVELHYL